MFLDISAPGSSCGINASSQEKQCERLINHNSRMRNIITWIDYVEKSEEMVSQPYENTSIAGSAPWGNSRAGWSCRSHTSLLWGPGHLCTLRKASVCTVGWREVGGDDCMEEVRAQSQNSNSVYRMNAFPLIQSSQLSSSGGFIFR